VNFRDIFCDKRNLGDLVKKIDNMKKKGDFQTFAIEFCKLANNLRLNDRQKCLWVREKIPPWLKYCVSGYTKLTLKVFTTIYQRWLTTWYVNNSQTRVHIKRKKQDFTKKAWWMRNMQQDWTS
jgi:hypothetical protein